ncbi:hypothetical protein V6Z11_A13G077600, partial [Gossypium hirsutum]
PSKLTTVKALSESSGLSSIPSIYTFPKQPNHEPVSDTKEPIPTIDFSLLISSNPDERSKTIRELGKACGDWGFFMVTNHGVPERMMKAMIEVCREFFELTEEEKGECEGKHVLDPIRYGTSFNPSVDKILYWRDYLKIFQHPAFHSPSNPPSFREIALEYSKRTRGVMKEIVRGISESLGLEDKYIEKASNLENCLQIMIANLYPSCPQPELAMGLPAHSDHGLLTLLIQNDTVGLQVLHKDKWVNIHPIPNSFLANIGDHIEILSNRKYKSVLHRAVVNDRDARISIALAHGPAMDAAVSPAPMLLEDGQNPLAYRAMKYKEYVELQQSNKLDGKSCLEHIRNRGIEIALEYSKRVRLVAREIIRGISESLGLEKDYIDETLNLENGLQLIAANLYPPCPQPELAMGLPPHSDHGLLTLLIQNQIGGLQVQHKGKWVNIDPIPNSFLANIGDHIEILSNGKYKSVLHRAVVNNRDVRISIAVPHGPALDAIVSPAPKLVEIVGNPPAYGAMKYKEYLELQQGSMLNGKSSLERIR